MHAFYLDAIKGFEGFTPKAAWDYAQHSNGFGTKARFAGEVIDKVEADRRFRSEIDQARAIVERFAPGVDEGTKAALTSLTYNAGDAWTRSGLGAAVRQGDMGTARDLFVQYNKAGGEVLQGLASRRLAEASWFGQPEQVGLEARAAPTGAAPLGLVAQARDGGAPAAAEPPGLRDGESSRVGEAPDWTMVAPVAAGVEGPAVGAGSGDEPGAATPGDRQSIIAPFEAQARLTRLMLAVDFLDVARLRGDPDESQT